MEECVTRIIDGHETADIFFLDFAKAFDSVTHRYELTKFRAYGIHDDIVSLVAAFLGNRPFRVGVNGFVQKLLLRTVESLKAQSLDHSFSCCISMMALIFSLRRFASLPTT